MLSQQNGPHIIAKYGLFIDFATILFVDLN